MSTHENGKTLHCLIGAPRDERSGPPPEPPAGLARCEECGEWNGEGTFAPKASAPRTFKVEVLCRCHGPFCLHCGERRIHRPCSYSYDERSGQVLHVAYFCAVARCPDCEARAGGAPFTLPEGRAPLLAAAPVSRRVRLLPSGRLEEAWITTGGEGSGPR